MSAALIIYYMDGEKSEIWFHNEKETQGPKYWKPTTSGILVKRFDNTRTIYHWTNIRCYTVVPTHAKGNNNDNE